MGLMNYFKISAKSTGGRTKDAETTMPTSISGEAPVELVPPPLLRQQCNHATTASWAVSGDAKFHIILDYVYREQQRLMWIQDHSGKLEGVMIRRDRNGYIFIPPTLERSSLAKAMAVLNVQASGYISLYKYY